MDPTNLLKLLLKANVDFIIIGGFAGTIHGSNLVTKDLDICMLLNPTTIRKLRDIFMNLHPVHRMTPNRLSFLVHPEQIENVKNIYLESDLGTLDILSSVVGVGDFERLKSKATKIELFGQVCNVISIEDLIASKKSMNRDKDKIAVKELEYIQKIKK